MADASRYAASEAFIARPTKHEKGNPRTGEAINVPEKTHALFRVGKELKGRVDAINRDDDDPDAQ